MNNVYTKNSKNNIVVIFDEVTLGIGLCILAHCRLSGSRGGGGGSSGRCQHDLVKDILVKVAAAL